MRWLRAIVPVVAVVVTIATDVWTYQPPQPVEKDHFVYFVDNAARLPSIDSSLNATRARLIGLLHDSLNYKPQIYIVGDQNYFTQLIGGSFPDWGAAAALPSLRRIVIKSPDKFNTRRPLGELLAHEYSHLALAARVGLYSTPRWFDEGTAMMVSMEWSWSDNVAMGEAAVFGRFIPLQDIDLVNRFSETRAHVAYAESYLAVSYFVKQYGVASLNLFLDQLERGASVDSALMAATGSDRRGFEQEFRAYMNNRFNFASLFMDTIYFWMALAFVLVIGAFLAYRRKRRYYNQWKEEDRFESKDFDYGDPHHPEQTDDEDDEPWRS